MNCWIEKEFWDERDLRIFLKVKEAKSLSLHLGSSTLAQRDGPPIEFYEELR